MTYRESFPETNRQCQAHFEEIKDLKLSVELKNHEIEDLKFELNTLYKKESIWHHLGETYEKANVEDEKKQYQEENEKLKSQLVSLHSENVQKNQIISELKEKINDLREYTAELKKLSDKSEQIHMKEVEVLRNSLNPSSEIIQLRKDKEKLENAISKCDIIGREMEEYYMNEINKIKKQLEDQRLSYSKLEKSKRMLEQEMDEIENEFKELKLEQRQDDSRYKESDFGELIKRQNQEKKWEIMLNQVRERYEKEIIDLKDQIKFLVVKVESLQDSKNFCEGLSTSVLTQSKLAMSTTSNDSFRFTPNNSFASSIKESLNRRDTAVLRTPNKNSRQKSSNLGCLLDRTNL